MAKGYWIAHLDILDPEFQKQYVAANQAAFKKFGARYIIRGGKQIAGFPSASRCAVKHGTMRDRHVVLEFDSYEQALACYESAEYQAALKFRDRGSDVDVVIIEGYDPAK
jgi:uncharacterized protein (DUF1330 family)